MTSVHADETHLPDQDVDLKTEYTLDHEFDRWEEGTTAEQKKAKVAGVIAVSGVAALAGLLTSTELDDHIHRLRKAMDSEVAGDPAARAVLRSQKLNLRASRSVSSLARVGAYYFIANAVTGTVMAMKGYEPMYTYNLPALASYLNHSSKEKAAVKPQDEKLARQELLHLMKNLK